MQSDKIDPDMPDEFREEQGRAQELRIQQLDSLSRVLAKKRQEAVDGRKASGIEQIWDEDDDAYEGIDDANRGNDSRIMKPTSMSGGLMRTRKSSTTRSTVFLRITTQYVDQAAARVGDMLLPSDDRAFEIVPLPMPEMLDFKGDNTPLTGPQGQPIPRPAQEGEQPQGGQNGVPVVQATNNDVYQQVMDEATKSAKAAEKKIDDWLIRCSYHAEKRKSIHDRARLGTSVMKGPMPIKARRTKTVRQPGKPTEVVIIEEIEPASKRIDPWNFYPDPACGENIHNGNFVFERDFITSKQLARLKGTPDYIDSQIDECLREGPQKAYVEDRGRKGTGDNDQFEIWYFYGNINVGDLQACGADTGDAADDEDARPALMTMVNDRVIKGTLNALDSGEFPYDVTPWQVRSGSPWGIGVSRQCREAQGMLNAAVRNLMDNAALSGGPILCVNRSLIKPVDNNWTLSARKMFETTDEADDTTDISHAIFAFNIPSMQQELMAIIEFALKMAEQTTGMPMLLQGQTGGAPDTLGGQILVNNNASTVLRRIARLDDDNDTEPHIRRYYEYLLIYCDDEALKGNFTIDARGSSALVERDIQNHATLQMLNLSKDPAFGVDPKKAFAEACKAQKLDPKRFQFSEEDMAKMAKATPPPPVPVQVAQINAQADIQVEAMRQHLAGAPGAPAQPGQAPQGQPAQGQQPQPQGQQAAQQPAPSQQPQSGNPNDPKLKIADMRRDTELQKANIAANLDLSEMHQKMQEAREQRAHELQMMKMKIDLATMEFAQQRGLALDEAKRELANTAMQVNADQARHTDKLAVELHKHHNPVASQVLQGAENHDLLSPEL